MASDDPGATPRTASLIVALITLLVPLLGIVVGTLDQPVPPPVVVDVAPAPIPGELPLLAPAPEPQPEPVAVVEPPPPPPAPARAPEPASPFPRWGLEENLNFLLVGIDRRTTDEIYRTDTIMIANLDLRARRAAVVSIPRDLVVSIPGYYQDRINSVYAIGETQKGRGWGLRLLRETVERNFGLRVNHYATVDFNCFRGTLDALGGVNVRVQERIYDPSYPTDDYGYKLVVFEPGLQWMDGERALEFARSRYGDTDFGRMRRQQQLLTAMREQALKVQSLGAVPQAVSACSGLSSDLNVFELLALGAAARDITPSNIAYRVIDERLASRYIAPSGADVLLPRWDDIRAMLRTSVPFASVSAPAWTRN